MLLWINSKMMDWGISKISITNLSKGEGGEQEDVWRECYIIFISILAALIFLVFWRIITQ